MGGRKIGGGAKWDAMCVSERERERGIEEERWRVCVYKREQRGEMERKKEGKGERSAGYSKCEV